MHTCSHEHYYNSIILAAHSYRAGMFKLIATYACCYRVYEFSKFCNLQPPVYQLVKFLSQILNQSGIGAYVVMPFKIING